MDSFFTLHCRKNKYAVSYKRMKSFCEFFLFVQPHIILYNARNFSPEHRLFSTTVFQCFISSP